MSKSNPNPYCAAGACHCHEVVVAQAPVKEMDEHGKTRVVLRDKKVVIKRDAEGNILPS